MGLTGEMFVVSPFTPDVDCEPHKVFAIDYNAALVAHANETLSPPAGGTVKRYIWKESTPDDVLIYTVKANQITTYLPKFEKRIERVVTENEKPLFGDVSNKEPGHRDAVHVPGVVAWCSSRLHPGDKVKFISPELVEKVYEHITAEQPVYHGIVDPFLDGKTSGVYSKPFWVLLKPGLVTALTHHFVTDIEVLEQKEEEEEDYDYDDGCRECY